MPTKQFFQFVQKLDEVDMSTLIDSANLHDQAKQVKKVVSSVRGALKNGATVGEWAETVAEGESARKFLQTVGQTGYDVRRMKRAIMALENVAKQGGNVGATGRALLDKSRAALVIAEEQYRNERALVGAAQETIEKYKEVANSAYLGKYKIKAGEFANGMSRYLKGSATGSKLLATGRVLTSKTMLKGLLVVNLALGAVMDYEKSPATTKTGKVANAAMGAAMSLGAKTLTVADIALPEEYQVSKIYKGAAANFTAIGEALLKDDSAALDNVHKEAMNGSYGKIHQAAAEAGEFWADRGIMGGLKEFKDSLSWWVSH